MGPVGSVRPYGASRQNPDYEADGRSDEHLDAVDGHGLPRDQRRTGEHDTQDQRGDRGPGARGETARLGDLPDVHRERHDQQATERGSCPRDGDIELAPRREDGFHASHTSHPECDELFEG